MKGKEYCTMLAVVSEAYKRFFTEGQRILWNVENNLQSLQKNLSWRTKMYWNN